MSGKAGWTAGSTHQHHALGTSQVRAHAPSHAPWQGTGSIGRIWTLGAYLAILSLSQPWVWTGAYTLSITVITMFVPF